MIGGDLAVREPARMLISVLRKIKNQNPNFTILRNMAKFNGCESGKRLSCYFVKKYYTKTSLSFFTTNCGKILIAKKLPARGEFWTPFQFYSDLQKTKETISMKPRAYWKLILLGHTRI